MLAEYHYLLFLEPKCGEVMLSHMWTSLFTCFKGKPYLIKCILVILGGVESRMYLKITLFLYVIFKKPEQEVGALTIYTGLDRDTELKMDAQEEPRWRHR